MKSSIFSMTSHFMNSPVGIAVNYHYMHVYFFIIKQSTLSSINKRLINMRALCL
ncbi:hypothetical protein THF5H11_30195 [Vibrio jasicida]|nr:hypothetical protein THF5H11_30195 [Vibrio jasicida]CAH1604988.1 hypothetical protein THF5G08_110037 [Vibrio jasicida]